MFVMENGNVMSNERTSVKWFPVFANCSSTGARLRRFAFRSSPLVSITLVATSLSLPKDTNAFVMF